MTQESDALDTETIEVELDPARALMYRLACDAGGEEMVGEFLEAQVYQGVEQLYDSRDDLALQREQMEEQAESEPTDIVEDATQADE